MAEPADTILPLLREMRAENPTRHEQSIEQFKAVVARLDKMEATLLSFRQAPTADTLLSRLVTGEFGERIEMFERKVRELERLK